MKTVRIPKKNGKTRLIYIPNEEEKAALRSIAGQIERKAARQSPEGVVHGFTRGKNPVTNAQAHTGHAYTTCMDLADFFDTVTPEHVRGKLKQEEEAIVFVDDAARQGLPTSPAVANLAAAQLDHAILRWRAKEGLQFVYTRYADDLAFSYDDISIRERLLQSIPAIVGRCGFRVNTKKTRTMVASNGRRIITGVAVDDTTVHAPRRVRRRLRAALHQERTQHARGLAEWCKMKPPRPGGRAQDSLEGLEGLLRVWKLSGLRLDRLPKKTPQEDLGENCLVTDDLIYMLGMSNWTTGWTSCMSQPSGQYRRGVIFWAHLRGTRIAAYLGSRTMVVGKVERHVMKARALVHELRNGVRVFDRLYPTGSTEAAHLERQLRQAGYLSVAEARTLHGKGVAVVGHAPARWNVYLDSLDSYRSRAKKGPWKGTNVRVVTL